MTKDTKRCYADCVRKLMKVEIMSLVIVANLHRRIIKEGRITYVRSYIIFLKLEIDGLNISQKLF